MANLIQQYGLIAQKCHFHQIKTIVKYLTSRPKLTASKKLLAIAESLPTLNREMLMQILDIWYEIYKPWLEEKTMLPNGKWQHTQKDQKRVSFTC